MLKKALVTAVAAAALATPASAATFISNINLNIGNCAQVCSGGLGPTAATSPSFDHYYTVTFPQAATAASQIGEITVGASGVDFSSVYLQLASGGPTYNFAIVNGNPSQATLTATGPLAAGLYNLFVAGVSNDSGNAYSGTVTLSAVPEPATWALFILGFGGLGYAMRRRNAKVTVAKAKLHFA